MPKKLKENQYKQKKIGNSIRIKHNEKIYSSDSFNGVQLSFGSSTI